MEIINSRDFISYNRKIATMIGVESAIVLDTIVKNAEYDRPIEIQSETLLSYTIIYKCLSKLVNLDILNIADKDILQQVFTVVNSNQKVSLGNIIVYSFSLVDRNNTYYIGCISDISCIFLFSCISDISKLLENISVKDNNNLSIYTDDSIIEKLKLEKGKKNEKKRQIVGLDEHAFEVIYKAYPRHVSKEQARKTFLKKAEKLNDWELKEFTEKILRAIDYQKEVWGRENNGNGREEQYIPHLSTWLNANIK